MESNDFHNILALFYNIPCTICDLDSRKMTRIENIKQPREAYLGMNALQRFQWWKQQYFMTLGICLVVISLPLFMFYRGNVLRGIRVSIILYVFLSLFMKIMRSKTNKKDKAFLESQGITEKPAGKIKKTFNVIFILLQIWVFWILYRVWMMSYGR